MIEWKNIGLGIANIVEKYFPENYKGNEDLELVNEIEDYFKSLIAKEFKIVARGEVTNDSTYVYLGNRLVGTRGYEIPEAIIKYHGKNISIYIGEEK